MLGELALSGTPSLRRGFVSALGLLLWIPLQSCSRPPVPAEPASNAAQSPAELALPSREEFVRNGLRPIGTTRAALAEALGAPDSTAAQTVPNRHVASETDTLFTVYFPDLAVHIHRPGPGGELLSSVEVRANRYLRYPIIGIDPRAVIDAFGPPDERTDRTLSYRCRSCVAGDDPVQISLEDGRVQAVRFSYYVD